MMSIQVLWTTRESISFGKQIPWQLMAWHKVWIHVLKPIMMKKGNTSLGEGRLISERGGIVIHEISLIKPAVSRSGFNHSFTQVILQGNPGPARRGCSHLSQMWKSLPLWAIKRNYLYLLKEKLRFGVSFFISMSVVLCYHAKPEWDHENPNSLFLKMMLAVLISASDYLWQCKRCFGLCRPQPCEDLIAEFLTAPLVKVLLWNSNSKWVVFWTLTIQVHYFWTLFLSGRIPDVFLAAWQQITLW